ncbi:hypothetical protein [Athalassotoga saccharophila]|uniref:hypothetical protein n=1 Tax=Athalassotoga saccharophila TaxID=1441386 RepID=UPI00137945A5|nr:hypothetical protein [Athalassotoga saccharophila]BBJ27652.1 hypothetical protein ATHSA_0529 [Athalassotoga saccharophila]
MIDVILLLGLPASGKSEIRRLMSVMSEKERAELFHIGNTLDIDDFPYVFLMRRIDEELERMGEKRIFYESDLKPFKDPRDWLTLTNLINEDYKDLVKKRELPRSAEFVIQRIEDSAKIAGISPRLSNLPDKVLKVVENAIEKESQKLLDDKYSNYGKKGTTIIEFSRGGSANSKLPLDFPFGYRHSLPYLSEEILQRSVILYVWVSPEESRRKNLQRSNPNDPGSILHHGVPEEVMIKEYGTDDMIWLEENSEKQGTVTVLKGNKKFHLPVANFDNRDDKTTFLRSSPQTWDKKQVDAIKSSLKSAFERLVR